MAFGNVASSEDGTPLARCYLHTLDAAYGACTEKLMSTRPMAKEQETGRAKRSPAWSGQMR